MKTFFPFLIALFIAACGSVSNPEEAVNRLQTPSGISSSQTDSIYQTLSYFPNQTQLAIAIINDSSATFYGALRKNDTLLTITNEQAVFEIGSLSKVFTSTVLADLVLWESMHLDEPIGQYLDFPLNNNLPITFKQLSNHTSGLPRVPQGFIWESVWHMDNPYKDYDEQELREYMMEDMELEYTPEDQYQYSNLGAGILGYVLTQIQERSYEQLLQQQIVQPLEMSQTTTQRQLVKERLVKGLNKRGNPTENWDLAALQGAGAILSTAEDLALFAQANFDPGKEAFQLTHQQTFRINDNRGIGLGWFLLKQESGSQWLWHNGGTGGYRSSMALEPKQKKGVVVLSNISAGHSHADRIDSLSFYLLESLLKVQAKQSE